MNKIETTIVNNETIHLRKGMLGWKVVYPVKIDNKINKKNLWLGSRGVIIGTIIWLLIMAFILYGVNTMVSSCRDMAKNPCKYFNIDCSRIKESYNKINTLPLFEEGERNDK